MSGTPAVPVAIAGKDLILSSGSTAVAGDTECKYTCTNKVGKIGPTCASFPKVGYAPGEVEEKIAFQSLLALDDTSLMGFLTDCQTGTVGTFSFAVGTGTISGSFYVESFELGGKAEDPAATASGMLVCFDTTNSLVEAPGP